jgi:ribosomal peptide maturation radical SAM protein 1
MDVLFAVLPFADVNRPAIGVSLLHSAARQAGFSSRIEYFNLDLAETIGLPLYGTLAYALPPDSLVGEWFFADQVFGTAIPVETDYVSRVLAKYMPDEASRKRILEARQHRAAFIDDCVRRIRAHRPRVVGFTSTFHQTCACLAVAKRLKEGPDPPVIMFGGANCEGEMGLTLIRSFPWIDYVSTGEADLGFPELLAGLLHDGRTEPPPGILCRGDVALTRPTALEKLDAQAIPDYADYFARIDASPLRPDLQPVCLVETSRGCWWGAKHHCTFCGLNGETMAFRSKSPGRVFTELALLSRTYQVKRVDCVDNILDVRYIQTLFPRLAASGLGLDLFYEVKSNLRYEQLALLRAGGMRAIQPGIESFSRNVLQLMKKGCSGAQNIQLLRWCKELGIDVGWNILAGFPGESPDDYRAQAELIPLLTHLQPPAACSPIRLDRFSPLYANAQSLGLARVRPAPAYYYAFPLGRNDLAKLAYYFDFDYADGRRPTDYLAPLMSAVQRWASAATGDGAPRLDAECDDAGISIADTREVAVGERHRLDGLAAQLYVRCDSSQTPAGLESHFGAWQRSQIHDALERLLAARLMIEIDGHYLSLAVIRNRAAMQASGQTHAA